MNMLKQIFSKNMLICIFTGMSSGMPLYVLYQMIPAWLRDSGVDLATIGLLSLIGLPYTWKFLWSPAMDRFVPPFLGRRRGWALLTQVALLIALANFAWFNPEQSIAGIAVLVFIVAFFSASQDIVLDAYRRELLADEELGLGNAFFVNAYRLSSLVPGSLALILADHMPWSAVHLVVAAFMLIGILTTILMPSTDAAINPPRSFREAIVDPFKEFFSRDGVAPAIRLLVFTLLYKLGDNMATALSIPFYLDLGFSKTEIGSIAKVAALWASIFGGFAGGIIMLKTGINRALWIFGVVQVVSILGFALLASVGHNSWLLFAVVSFEYLGVGLGTAALVAFISKSTDKRFTATQFALLSSLSGVARTVANASTGFLIEFMGYTNFFILCAVLALPGMFLLLQVAPWNAKEKSNIAAG